jgi:hypothetical protein
MCYLIAVSAVRLYSVTRVTVKWLWMSSHSLCEKKLIQPICKIQSQRMHREMNEIYKNLGQDSQFPTRFELDTSWMWYRNVDYFIEVFSVVMFFFCISWNTQYGPSLTDHATSSLGIPDFCIVWVYILIHFCRIYHIFIHSLYIFHPILSAVLH